VSAAAGGAGGTAAKTENNKIDLAGLQYTGALSSYGARVAEIAELADIPILANLIVNSDASRRNETSRNGGFYGFSDGDDDEAFKYGLDSYDKPPDYYSQYMTADMADYEKILIACGFTEAPQASLSTAVGHGWCHLFDSKAGKSYSSDPYSVNRSYIADWSGKIYVKGDSAAVLTGDIDYLGVKYFVVDRTAEECLDNMRKIKSALALYDAENTEYDDWFESSVFNPLVTAGYLESVPRCPSGETYGWGYDRDVECGFHGDYEKLKAMIQR
jgi:hypothetical protein